MTQTNADARRYGKIFTTKRTKIMTNILLRDFCADLSDAQIADLAREADSGG